MIPPLWLYGGAGALLAGALAGWTVRDWKADSDALKAEESAFKQYTALTDALADQSLAYEVLAQSLRAEERRDRETIREIYRDRQVPAVCAADPAVRSVLSEAVARANAAASGQSGSEMP
jgi:hypothetical protein